MRRLLTLGPNLPEIDGKALRSYAGLLNDGMRYIPTGMKVALALASGLCTMMGWDHIIVVTVGEKIGETYLTLSSAAAGTMAAKDPGLQLTKIRNMALARVLTLPAVITLAGVPSSSRAACSEVGLFLEVAGAGV